MKTPKLLIATPSPSKRVPDEPKVPVRARGHNRVNKIVESAITLLEDYEIDQLTIVMIADHAQVGRSSIYEFFPTVSSIIRVIAERYADEVREYTGDLLVKLNSHLLEEIVDALIDGTVEFYNQRRVATKIHLGSDASFSLRTVIKDFNKQGALLYHQWYKPSWKVKPLANNDPFRTLSVLQYALFSESGQRHGYITEYFRKQTKLVAHSYLHHYTESIALEPAKKKPIKRK